VPDDDTAWDDVTTVDVDDPTEPGTLALPTPQADGITAWRIHGTNEHGDGPPSDPASRPTAESTSGDRATEI
jgi:hypothetical protein